MKLRSFRAAPPILALLWLATVATLPAATAAAIAPAPLGLPRLAAAPRPGQPAALAAGRFTVDDLPVSATAGASRLRRDDLDLLVLDAGREWSRPLRGSPRDVSFVSFQLNASANTIVDVAGVRLGITLSLSDGRLQIMYDAATGGALQWTTLNFHVRVSAFSGRTFAALPTLTVRLDPTGGTWDLFFGATLLADHLPLIAATKDDRRFVLRAGEGGAWLSGLVLADENPLFVDTNANGIDDDFEHRQRGALATATASLAERRQLVKEWKDSQRRQPPPPLYAKRPVADRPAGLPRS